MLCISCTSLPITAETASLPVAAECRLLSPLADPGQSRLDVLEFAVERALLHDSRCGPPSPHHRSCRAIFVAGESRPVDYLDQPAEMIRSVALVLWAADEGAVATDDPEVIGAWNELAKHTLALVDATTERAQAQALVGRSALHVVNPLAAAASDCQLGQ